eukprot:Sro140_g065480.1 Inherit from NOG: surface antigen (1094) ;mRNA; r:51836-55117
MLPLSVSEVVGEDAVNTVRLLKAEYIQCFIKSNREGIIPRPEQHGWVRFLKKALEEGSGDSKLISEYLLDMKLCRKERVLALAYAKDRDGLVAISTAPLVIRDAFYKRLFFLGRYDLDKGPPIHKSPTSLVLSARDGKMDEFFANKFKPLSSMDRDAFRAALLDMDLVKGNYLQSIRANQQVGRRSNDAVFDGLCVENEDVIDELFAKVNSGKRNSISEDEFVEFCLNEFGNKVAIKFMKDKTQFQKETDGRDDLDTKYVVGVICKHDGIEINNTDLNDTLEPYILGVPTEERMKYSNVVVMPFGDRNLDSIYRCERPDLNAARVIMKQVGDALNYLHGRGIIHGDLKMASVIRSSGRYKLIDLDASVRLMAQPTEYIGAKFSSGILPPEMIHCNESFTQAIHYAQYFGYEQPQGLPSKLKIKVPEGGLRSYNVKTFRLQSIMEEVEDPFNGEIKQEKKTIAVTHGLPYKDSLVEAGLAVDVWSFGVMLYAFCTGDSGKSLFDVDRNDDLSSGDEMKELYDWSEATKQAKLDHVVDSAAKKLLNRILSKNPADRPTSMGEILSDDFFCTERKLDIHEVADEASKSIEETVHEESIKTREHVTQKHEEAREHLAEKIREVQTSIYGLSSQLQKNQSATTKMLTTLLLEACVPKYLYLLPKDTSTMMANPKNWIGTQVMLHFVCPISLEVPLDGDGKPIGYEIQMRHGWVKTYGPALLKTLGLLQIGFALGRCRGLPLPCNGGADQFTGQLLSDNGVEFLKAFEGHVRGAFSDPEEIEPDDENAEDWKELATSAVSEFIGDAAEVDPELPETQQSIIKLSYKKIKMLAQSTSEWNDPNFENCGLVKAVHGPSGISEYVHPDVKALFEQKGTGCYDMSPEEIEAGKLRANSEVREALAKEQKKYAALAEKAAVYRKLKVQVLQDEQDRLLERKSHVAKQLNNTPGSQPALDEELQTLQEEIEKKAEDIKREEHQVGAAKTFAKVQQVYCCAVEKQRKYLPFLWKQQYYAWYDDGSVRYSDKESFAEEDSKLHPEVERVTPADTTGYGFVLKFRGKNPDILLRAKSEEDFNAWVDKGDAAIQAARKNSRSSASSELP